MANAADGTSSSAPAKADPSQQNRTLQIHEDLYLERLNEVHFGTQITLSALKTVRDGVPKKTGSPFHHFEVPTGSGTFARIRRGAKGVERLLDRLMTEDEYGKSLLMMVSITEDYVINMLRMILRAHPDRLTIGLGGGTSEKTVPIAFLLTKGWSVVLEELIEERIYQSLHASPAQYIKFLKRLLHVEVGDALMASFAEVKATRDVIVHAKGLANAVYVRKAGSRSRAPAGSRLPMDRNYFDGCTMTMKELISNIHRQIGVKYADDPDVQREAGRLS